VGGFPFTVLQQGSIPIMFHARKEMVINMCKFKLESITSLTELLD